MQFPFKTKDNENVFSEFITKSLVNMVLNKRSHLAFFK